MSWDRKQRQEAILREKIAIIVLERLSDPRLGFITVTNVELSKDKKIAKVFYTVLGTDAQIRSTSRALADGRGRVQEMLAPTLNMRSMPELRFIFDAQVQKESRLLDIISEVTAERIERAGPDEELESELAFAEGDDGLEVLDIADLEGEDEDGLSRDTDSAGSTTGSDAEPEVDDSPAATPDTPPHDRGSPSP